MLMKNSFIKCVLPVTAIAFFGLCSCTSQVKLPDDVEMVTEGKEEVISYPLSLTKVKPGEAYSYRYLWKGYDDALLDGIQGSKDNRTLTFLNDYGPSEGYYFVYLSKSDYEASKKEVELSLKDKARYPFSFDEEMVVDGKYLLGAQLLGKTAKALVLKSETLENIPLETDGYRLVFALEKQNVRTLEEASSVTAFKKETAVYNALRLSYDSITKKFSMENQNMREGKMLEMALSSFKDTKAIYAPTFGMEGNTDSLLPPISVKVKTIDGKDYLPLPRYGLGNVDLLDKDTEISPYIDVYRDEKEDFLAALTDEEGASDNYALFDYSKVKEIIARYHAK